MANRAPDIQELEDLLNAAASDSELSAKASEICDRLRVDILLARHAGKQFRGSDLDGQLRDFEQVILEIWDRRSDTVLDEFIEHVRVYGGPLNG